MRNILHGAFPFIAALLAVGSIKYFQVFIGGSFLVLKSNLSAIVPSRFLIQSEASMSDLASALGSHSLEEKM